MNLSIGLFVPQAVPSQRGGLERFAEGLSKALDQAGKCTLIQIPVDERTFEEIQRGYKKFYESDTSEFDLVVSCKAPSYLIQHPNHINYLNHRMRVFYDQHEHGNPEREKQRELIHKMDRAALDPGKISSQFVVGKTVQKRLQRWGGLESRVLYHPTTLEGLHPGKYDYFLFAGRFHKWKRGDLVIKSYLASKSETPLVMVGSGEDEQEWFDLAQGNKNIIFKGEVSDSELVNLYANALAVIFPPLNEDYGLVTVEAFLSEKPVITCRDSGEPLEFVQDQVSGLVAEPNVESLSQKIKFCDENKNLAPLWGKAGKIRVQDITWENVVSQLLGKEIKSLKQIEEKPAQKKLQPEPVFKKILKHKRFQRPTK